MGRNQYWAGRVYDLCVYYMTGIPEGSTESGFMEKPGFEPATCTATPGLQGIALIHYTTGGLPTLLEFPAIPRGTMALFADIVLPICFTGIIIYLGVTLIVFITE